MSAPASVTTDVDFFFAEKFLVLLNVLDAAFTMFWLSTGLATEANPLLAAAWTSSPLLFLLVKASLLAFGMTILHSCRRLPAARAALATAVVTYGGVVAWHVLHV